MTEDEIQGSVNSSIDSSVDSSVKSKVPSVEEVAAEWREKVAYLAAEMENMKKRFARERGELIKMANEELIKNLLPVYDNLDLALKSIRETEEKVEANSKDSLVGNLLKGVDMTLVHFQNTLERLGVKLVESEGKPFDPAHHEAMGQSSDENAEDNVVTSEFQKGFTLHGRVIRPARVIVNKTSKE